MSACASLPATHSCPCALCWRHRIARTPACVVLCCSNYTGRRISVKTVETYDLRCTCSSRELPNMMWTTADRRPTCSMDMKGGIFAMQDLMLITVCERVRGERPPCPRTHTYAAIVEYATKRSHRSGRREHVPSGVNRLAAGVHHRVRAQVVADA